MIKQEFDRRQRLLMAEWLYENTSISYGYIASVCGLNIIEIEDIAEGKNKLPFEAIDPLRAGFLTRHEMYLLNHRPEIPPAESVTIETQLNHISKYIDDKAVTDIHLVQLYNAGCGRNAWHTTWTTPDDFFGQRFFATLGAAKDYLEQYRVQGNHMVIRSLPAIAFLGEQNTLVCVYSGLSYKRLIIDGSNIPSTMGELLKDKSWIKSEREHNTGYMMCRGRVKLEPLCSDSVLSAYEANPAGKGCLLNYIRSDNDKIEIRQIFNEIENAKKNLYRRLAGQGTEERECHS